VRSSTVRNIISRKKLSVCGHDLAREETGFELFGRDVERDHLIGRAQERERHDFAHREADEAFGRCRDGLEVLDVESAAHRNAGVAQGERVLPTLEVRAALQVRVREFVE
jgi:hypothetical protein